jgi:alpha-glucosidase
MPWTRALPARAWLPQPEWWGELSVEAEEGDEDSVLSLYRRALALRPSGGFSWRDGPAGVLAFDRDELTCVVNVSGPDVPVEGIVLASEDIGFVLSRGSAAWLSRASG